jgi:hypothetical protein
MVMGNLRDQLLKQGLVSKEKAKDVEKQIKAKTHQEQKGKKKKLQPEVGSESISYLAAKAREEEVARAKELNRQQEEARQLKAMQAQVNDLLQAHYLNDEYANGIYYFAVNGKVVKSLLVTSKQRSQLAHGQLAIAALVEDDYYLIPAEIAVKIWQRFPQAIVCHHQSDDGEKLEVEILHPIPDELIW